jgi:hypothetical protein
VSGIIEFLEARIAADEAEAMRLQQESDFGLEAFGNYMLAECAAKRAILAECRPGTLDYLDAGEDDQPAPMWVARALATVYKDHPDYQPEWAHHG